MIKREHYIEQVRPFYESDLIKIITGVRRCGKSVFLDQIIKEISEKTDNIIYLIILFILTSKIKKYPPT